MSRCLMFCSHTSQAVIFFSDPTVRVIIYAIVLRKTVELMLYNRGINR